MRRCNLTAAFPIIKQCFAHFALQLRASVRVALRQRSVTPRNARSPGYA
jgi:hypothetical protein